MQIRDALRLLAVLSLAALAACDGLAPERQSTSE